MGYRVGSEDWYVLESRSLSGLAADQKAPRGLRHAVAPGEETAACGFNGPLYIYASWESPGMMAASDKCDECRAFVEAHPI